jgi:branched-chain amino acid transport system ATP-binding protein
MITVENLVKHFGGIHAVDNASLVIEPGSITGLIGPNGAGKTTLFNVIAGVYKPTSGRVLLDGDDITGLPPHELFNRGMLRTFQIAHEFSTLTVRENLMMVPGNQSGERLVDAWFRPLQVRDQEAAIRAKADEVIEFLQIAQVADELAGNLSGGQKKLLELGRTMMVDAKIVFLDEVGAGVNRTLLNTIGDAILRLNRERGYTFCMIEHDMDFISRLCDPVIVMAEGSVLATGSAAEVKSNEAVIEAYLGTGMKNRMATAAGAPTGAPTGTPTGAPTGAPTGTPNGAS